MRLAINSVEGYAGAQTYCRGTEKDFVCDAAATAARRRGRAAGVRTTSFAGYLIWLGLMSRRVSVRGRVGRFFGFVIRQLLQQALVLRKRIRSLHDAMW